MQKRVGFPRAHLTSETCRHGGRFLAALAVVHACFGQSDVRCRKPVRFCKSFACKSRGRNCSRQPGLASSLRGEAWLPAATAACEAGLSLCGLVGRAEFVVGLVACGNSGPVGRAELVWAWLPAATAAREVGLSL